MNARYLSVYLFAGLLLLLLPGCIPEVDSAAAAGDAGYVRTYQDSAGSNRDGEVETSGAAPFAAEVDQLARLANAEGQALVLQPASADALAWLELQNVPPSLRDFYAGHDPQADVESDGVFLRPLNNLREVNTNTPLGQLLNRNGLLIVATTISGDLYYLDARALDSAGEAPIYLLNHERVAQDAALSEIESQSVLAAVSFRQFLSLFLQAGLQYDISVPAEPLVDPARRAFFARYEREGQRFAVRYPAAWFTTQTADDAATHFVNRSAPGAPGGTVVTILEQRRAADLEVAARTIADAIRSQAGVSDVELTATDAVLVNDRPGYELVIAYSLQGTRLVQRTVLVDAARQTFVVSLTTVQAQSETMFAIFDAMLGSFHIVDGAS